MRFTKSTTRALAASVAFVAAGATVAGAAVFQLPILGFGRADLASATASPAGSRPALPVVRPPAKAEVIVKSRYVDDIVHRRASAGTDDAQSASSTLAPPLAPLLETTTSSTIAESRDDASDHDEHETESDDDHGTKPTPSTAPAVEDE